MGMKTCRGYKLFQNKYHMCCCMFMCIYKKMYDSIAALCALLNPLSCDMQWKCFLVQENSVQVTFR